MRTRTPSPSARVRARLDHPVVDIDGHILEFMPTVLDFVRAELGGEAFDRFVAGTMWAKHTPGGWYSEAQVRASRLPRVGWWQYPARNTLDRATVMLPRLLYERMEELGFDYTVLYPTICLGTCALHDADVRRAVCRGYNNFCAEVFRPYADRMTAAGVIPSDLAAGNKQGYSFVYAATADSSGRYNTYSVNANPVTVGTTGTNYYFTDQTAVIRQNSTQQASASDPPIGG